jgi:hypothetical protein
MRAWRRSKTDAVKPIAGQVRKNLRWYGPTKSYFDNREMPDTQAVK